MLLFPFSVSQTAYGMGQLVCLMFLVTTAACDEQQAKQPPKSRPPAPIRVASVLQQNMTQSVTLVGTVEPWKRSTVASENAGLVQKFLVNEGMAVKKGQVLAQLRTDTLKIQLDSVLASYREANTRHIQAKQDLQRIKVLFGKELVTQKEFDDALAQQGALRERVSQLKAEIRQVHDQIDKSKIVAPFTGWVTREFTEVGQWIQMGGPVIEIVDLSYVQIEVPLPERFVQDIHVNNAVTALFDSLRGFEEKGRIFSVVAQADRVSRTFPVKIKIPNPRLMIKSGMVSRVTLMVGQPHKGLVIPKDALVLRGGNTFVFLVTDGIVKQIPITVNTQRDKLVEVSGPLQEGMMVVVEGNERLFPGQPVRILQKAKELL